MWVTSATSAVGSLTPHFNSNKDLGGRTGQWPHSRIPLCLSPWAGPPPRPLASGRARHPSPGRSSEPESRLRTRVPFGPGLAALFGPRVGGRKAGPVAVCSSRSAAPIPPASWCMLRASTRLVRPISTRLVQLALSPAFPALALNRTRQHSVLCNQLKMASTTDKVKVTQDSWELPKRAAGVEDPTIKVYNSLTRTKVSWARDVDWTG